MAHRKMTACQDFGSQDSKFTELPAQHLAAGTQGERGKLTLHMQYLAVLLSNCEWKAQFQAVAASSMHSCALL